MGDFVPMSANIVPFCVLRPRVGSRTSFGTRVFSIRAMPVRGARLFGAWRPILVSAPPTLTMADKIAVLAVCCVTECKYCTGSIPMLSYGGSGPSLLDVVSCQNDVFHFF